MVIRRMNRLGFASSAMIVMIVFFQEIRRNLPNFTLAQRSALAIKKEDIFYNFIYQIGIMLEDHPERMNNPGEQ